MTQKNDGGPAYPCKVYTQGGHPNGESMGMTLRDWFAGQALAGLILGYTHTFEQHVARNAYKLADAMLAARDAKP